MYIIEMYWRKEENVHLFSFDGWSHFSFLHHSGEYPNLTEEKKRKRIGKIVRLVKTYHFCDHHYRDLLTKTKYAIIS